MAHCVWPAGGGLEAVDAADDDQDKRHWFILTVSPVCWSFSRQLGVTNGWQLFYNLILFQLSSDITVDNGNFSWLIGAHRCSSVLLMVTFIKWKYIISHGISIFMNYILFPPGLDLTIFPLHPLIHIQLIALPCCQRTRPPRKPLKISSTRVMVDTFYHTGIRWVV